MGGRGLGYRRSHGYIWREIVKSRDSAFVEVHRCFFKDLINAANLIVF